MVFRYGYGFLEGQKAGSFLGWNNCSYEYQQESQQSGDSFHIVVFLPIHA
jgi:hypothetical protein